MEHLCQNTQLLQWHRNHGVSQGTLGGGTYAVSLLLLPEVLQAIARQGSGKLVLAVTSRDVVLACVTDFPAAIQRIKFLNLIIFPHAAYVVLPHTFYWRDGQFELRAD